MAQAAEQLTSKRLLSKKEVHGLTKQISVPENGILGRIEQNTRALEQAVQRLYILHSKVTTMCEKADENPRIPSNSFDGLVHEQRDAVSHFNSLIDGLGTHLLGDEWRNHHMPLQKERV